MKRLALVLCTGLFLVMAASAWADYDPLSNVFDAEAWQAMKDAAVSHNPGGETRTGGENIATATVIPALPYADADNTCGHINDYVPTCVSGTSPDLVYAYTPGASGGINISLCGSSYDTVIQVYANNASTPVACNDDACGLQSELLNVPVTLGNTYYIVIDGYGGGCGAYTLNVTAAVPCLYSCPTGSQIEGEPICFDNYVDAFNGGCNSTPQVFSPVTCSHICGEAGTFISPLGATRDTDWYRFTVPAGGGNYTLTGMGSGFTLLYGYVLPACTAFLQSTTTPCAPLVQYLAGGTVVYLWAGTSTFAGVPCGSQYWIDIQGPGIPTCGVTAVENKTWGAIKGVYR